MTTHINGGPVHTAPAVHAPPAAGAARPAEAANNTAPASHDGVHTPETPAAPLISANGASVGMVDKAKGLFNSGREYTAAMTKNLAQKAAEHPMYTLAAMGGTALAAAGIGTLATANAQEKGQKQGAQAAANQMSQQMAPQMAPQMQQPGYY